MELELQLMELAFRIESGETFSADRIKEELRYYHFLLDEYQTYYDPYMCNKLRASIKVLSSALKKLG